MYGTSPGVIYTLPEYWTKVHAVSVTKKLIHDVSPITLPRPKREPPLQPKDLLFNQASKWMESPFNNQGSS